MKRGNGEDDITQLQQGQIDFNKKKFLISFSIHLSRLDNLKFEH